MEAHLSRADEADHKPFLQNYGDTSVHTVLLARSFALQPAYREQLCAVVVVVFVKGLFIGGPKPGGYVAMVALLLQVRWLENRWPSRWHSKECVCHDDKLSPSEDCWGWDHILAVQSIPAHYDVRVLLECVKEPISICGWYRSKYDVPKPSYVFTHEVEVTYRSSYLHPLTPSTIPQINDTLHLIAPILCGHASSVAVKPSACDAYNAALQARIAGLHWMSCRSWFCAGPRGEQQNV